MKIFLSFFLLFTLGCQNVPINTVRTVDPALEYYVSTLETMLGFKVNYTVKLGDLPSNQAGLCSYSSKHVIITIDQEFFDRYHPTMPLGIEGLVLHELGHCTFRLEHEDIDFDFHPSIDPLLQGCPITVMNSVTEPYCYSTNRQYYINEFKTRAGIP